jgi:hypothetical protein
MHNLTEFMCEGLSENSLPPKNKKKCRPDIAAIEIYVNGTILGNSQIVKKRKSMEP